MKECITRNRYSILAILFVAILWHILSRIYSPLVVPPISLVGRKLAQILTSVKLWREIGSTIRRLSWGLGIGMLLGGGTGLIGGIWKDFRETWKPILGMIQVIPPVSWLILAIIWFGFNGKASIFIVVMAVVPSVYICIADGIAAIDRKLLEMGTVFDFSVWKKMRYILLPSLSPYFGAALKIAVGTACKTVVMGEVLTTTSGIGGQIMTARLNIEPETVIAWTVIVVGIYYGAMGVGKLIQKGKTRIKRKRQGK